MLLFPPIEALEDEEEVEEAEAEREVDVGGSEV